MKAVQIIGAVENSGCLWVVTNLTAARALPGAPEMATRATTPADTLIVIVHFLAGSAATPTMPAATR